VCVATAALAMLSEGVLARVDVHIDFDEKFDFTKVKTWAWTAGYGEVKMARTKDDDPDAIRKQAEPIIVEAVTAEVGKKLQTVTASPDLQVTYYLLLTTNMNAQVIGQFLPAQTAWGLPPFLAATQSLEVMNQGSLVLDLSANSHVVWRGIAQAKIKMDADRKKREDLIREAARDLMNRYPPKPKK
jgi:hypothetical protein